MFEIEDAVKYFNNCKTKFLRRFNEKTPEGNIIKGWICNKPNRYLGSLLIDEVNGVPHEQFVQSMPKIEYYNNEKDICLDSDECGMLFTDAVAFEKLDGSCLIIYPILCDNGKIIEIVPKTRGKAVADEHFLELFNKIDKSGIMQYYKSNIGILFFELYGILNQHEIIHYQTGIDIVLIGSYDSDGFGIPFKLWRIAGLYNLKLPDEMFRISRDRVEIITSKYRWYFDDIDIEDNYASTRFDSIEKIKEYLEFLNSEYHKKYGRYAVEGVVINCVTCKGNQKYIKVKPSDIENKHRSENGIPRNEIMKEVLKYFDDYGHDVEDIYRENPNHHTEYIHRMLLEEYPEEIIKKSSKKIEKIFIDVWNSKIPPKSIHLICEQLFEEYGENGITRCMQEFAKQYPMKKKDASTVYNVLEKIFKKNKQ